MQVPVILRPGESGYIVASAPTLPGCHSQGKTREEALANIHEAIEVWLEAELIDKEGSVPPHGLVELVDVEVDILRLGQP